MVFADDLHISDEVSYKSEENILSEHNYNRKRDVVLIDANFSNDPCSETTLNKSEETISGESNIDTIANIIYPLSVLISCGKLVQCVARVLNELDSDYNSDDFISTVVYPYHKVAFNVYSSQCEK
ncbi:unnamed protein product [Schistosoma curassoni]|uniref:Reverse transcriptase domain-containing protein n=1 Tax=Schistosoma curassoni TaxID=6186 RepID=A0A183KJY2_9TREM|nr:unnamed protein product [Schistosoma curassoni]